MGEGGAVKKKKRRKVGELWWFRDAWTKKLVLVRIKIEKGGPWKLSEEGEKSKREGCGLQRRDRNQRGLWKGVNVKDAWEGLSGSKPRSLCWRGSLLSFLSEGDGAQRTLSWKSVVAPSCPALHADLASPVLSRALSSRLYCFPSRLSAALHPFSALSHLAHHSLAAQERLSLSSGSHFAHWLPRYLPP